MQNPFATENRNMSTSPPPGSPFGSQGGQNPFGDQPPAGPPNPYQPSPYAPSSQPAGLDPALKYVVPIGASIWAVLAGYCGLLSLALCFLGPPAILFGILGLRDIKRNPHKHGTFRCIIGIVLGALGSLGFVLLIILLLSGAVR